MPFEKLSPFCIVTMALWSWLIGAIIAIYVCKILNRFREFVKYRNMVNKLPGPKEMFIIGNLWDFIFLPYEDAMNTCLELLRLQQKSSVSLIRFWASLSAKIMILKGSAAEAILKNSKNVEKPYEYEFLKCFLGDGLLTSKKELWAKRRKVINPSFNPGFIKEFIPIFNDKADILVEILGEQVVGKGPFNIETYFVNASLDILCQTVLGVNVNIQRNPDADIVTAHREIGNIVVKRIYHPWLWLNSIYNWTHLKKLENTYVPILRDFSRKVVRERRAFLEKTHQNGVREVRKDDEEVYGMKRRKTTMDVLLESTCDGRKLTDEEVVDEVGIQITAGHETTASSIGFASFLLGHHPEIQKKVQQEVDLVLGETDRPVTFTDLANLKYLDAMMKECYRLYPPVPFFGRVLDEDTVVDGFTVPANTSISFPLMAIHRDPEVFPDPEKFDPERFLGSSAKGPSAYDYMPFGAGPRNCIGYRVAQMEGRIILAKILQKYDIISNDKPEDLKLASTPDLRSIHGINVSLQRRINR